MKPSDVKAEVVLPAEDLPHPRSQTADPPITLEEARSATPTNCRWHNGLIKSQPTEEDVDGKVFFCPIGKMYWRYSKLEGDFYKPLPYPKFS